MISEGGAGVAYTWNGEAGEWEKIGQVVDGPGAGGDNSNMAVGSKVSPGSPTQGGQSSIQEGREWGI